MLDGVLKPLLTHGLQLMIDQDTILEILGGGGPELDVFKENLNSGASELDLVRSGLDDSMRQAFQEMRETRLDNNKVKDYRTAAYVNAIRKISRSYIDVGVY